MIERLWELEQANVISFNDMEYDVASKVGIPIVLCDVFLGKP